MKIFRYIIINIFLSICLLFLSTGEVDAARIISLKPNITEILFALDVGEQLVGVTSFCFRPEAAKKITRVADYITPDIEKVLSQRPDMILSSKENSSQKEIKFFEERGLQVNLFDFSTIDQTLQSIRSIGKIVDREELGKKLALNMEEQLRNIRETSNKFSPKRVLMIVGYQPLIVVGSNNFLDESLKILGVINVAGESKIAYPTYTTELLIHAAPEIVLDLTMGSEKDPEKNKQWWEQFRSIPAVKNRSIYFLDIEKLRAVPSLPIALWEVFRMIHPTAPQSIPNR